MRQDNKDDRIDHIIHQPFIFDEWKDLNEKDPELFDAKRDAWVEEFIDSAPESYQDNLRNLMSKVDTIRNKNQDPMQSCQEISNMMVNSLSDLRYFLKDLNYSLTSRVNFKS